MRSKKNKKNKNLGISLWKIMVIVIVAMFAENVIALPLVTSNQTNIPGQSSSIIDKSNIGGSPSPTYTDYYPPYTYHLNWGRADLIASINNESGANGWIATYASCFLGGGHSYAVQGMQFYVGRQKTVTITATFLTSGIAATVGMPSWAMAKTAKVAIKEDTSDTNNFYEEDIDPPIDPIDAATDAFSFIINFLLPFFPLVGTAKNIAEAFEIISTLMDVNDLVSKMYDMIDAGKAETVTITIPMNVGPGYHNVYVGSHAAAAGVGATGWAVRFGVIEKIRIDGIAPPDTPTVGGPESGKQGETYEFWAQTNDPNNDDVKYQFDWGDGDVSSWTQFANSGEKVHMSHEYSEPGTYTIKVRAMDVDQMKSDYGNHTITIRELQPPKLKWTPIEWDFGEVRKGQRSEGKKFILENIGDETAVGMVMITDIFHFPIVGTTGLGENYTFILETGEKATVTIKFAPTAEKDYYAQLKAFGANCDSVTADLYGTGTNGCCFPAGTKITMADGSYKNIEDIRRGDKILGYDTESGKFYSWTVTLLGHPIRQVYDVNGGLLSLTCDHPVYIKKSDGAIGWGAINPKFAQEVTRVRENVLSIEIGDSLLTSEGNWIKIDNITCKSERIQTYNIRSFTGTHTYFANDLLVFEENPPLLFMIKNFPWVVKRNIIWLIDVIQQIIEKIFGDNPTFI